MVKKREEFASAEEYISYLEKLVGDLQNSERVLIALENAGVDNWDGYSYAMEIMETI